MEGLFKTLYMWIVYILGMGESETVLIEFLGDTPLIRVLDFLIVFREYDYNKQDM